MAFGARFKLFVKHFAFPRRVFVAGLGLFVGVFGLPNWFVPSDRYQYTIRIDASRLSQMAMLNHSIIAVGALALRIWLGLSPSVLAVFIGAEELLFYLYICHLAKEATEAKATVNGHLEDGFLDWKTCTYLTVNSVLRVVIPIAAFLFIFGLFLRLPMQLAGLLMFPILGGTGVFVYNKLRMLENGDTPWHALGIGVIGIPLLLSWVITPCITHYIFGGGAADLMGHEEIATRNNTFTQRSGRAKKHPVEGGDLVIAVMLSGGGYRAALIHAGVLQALDEAGLRINYLSTVSGGSIVGTYYALGYTPQEFKTVLKRSKPDLPNDLLNFGNVFRDWAHPKYSSSDTFSAHLERVFFGRATLSDTRKWPLLLVNATDYDAEREFREVFYKKKGDARRNNTKLSELVAASAAFPLAFQPKTIKWTNDAGDRVHRRFVDGGVMENLGLEGLHRYFHLELSASAPDILIISDASKPMEVGSSTLKAGMFQMGTRTFELASAASHKYLYTRYIGRPEPGDVPPRGQPFCVSQTVLGIKIPKGRSGTMAVFVLDHTSQKTAFLLRNLPPRQMPPSGRAGDEVAREVKRYDTLKELDPHEVENAWWLGRTVTQKYLEKLKALLSARLRKLC